MLSFEIVIASILLLSVVVASTAWILWIADDMRQRLNDHAMEMLRIRERLTELSNEALDFRAHLLKEQEFQNHVSRIHHRSVAAIEVLEELKYTLDAKLSSIHGFEDECYEVKECCK